VIIVQRVRVRWGARSRGSTHATRRSGLPDAFILPTVQPQGVVVHDVLMDEMVDYRASATVGYGVAAARNAGLWLEFEDDALTVDRMPGDYPNQRPTQRLFTLAPGRIGRYRANFRFRGESAWYYELWTVHVANRDDPGTDVFTNHRPHRDVDDRVHLYGGR